MNWYGKTLNSHNQGVVADEDTGGTIAVVYDDKHTALVAAAPALLRLLKEARDRLDYLTPDQFDDTKHEANYLQLLKEIDEVVRTCQPEEGICNPSLSQ